MKFSNYGAAAWFRQTFGHFRIPSALPKIALVVLAGLCVGLAVIISTYYVNNVKLLIGLIGGFAFVLLTMRWPEFGILSLLALLSGLISLGWLPLLHLGPISLNISDIMLLILLVLVLARATTRPGFILFSSPLTFPLLFFIGAFLLSAVISIFIYGVNINTVLRTVRMLSLWIVFIPTLQLVRSEQSLKRLLSGLLVLAGILLIGVLYPNRFEPLLHIEEYEARADFTRIYYAGDMVLYAMIPVTVASLATIKSGNQFARIGLLFLLLYWVLKTYFRQYWLTLFVICILLVGFLSIRERIRLFKRLAPAIAAIMLIALVLMSTQSTLVERFVQPLTDRLASLSRDPLMENSLQWRLIETQYALQQISRHPVIGLGLANRYRPPMENETYSMYSGWSAKYIENGYLYIAVMMGLVGLIPFIWLCAAFLFRILRYQHEIRDDGLRAVYLGLGVSFLGMMACNLVTPTFVVGGRLVFFPVSMAIIEVILRLEREKRVLL